MFGLSSETLEGVSLTLKRVNDIHRGDGLVASVLGVRHAVTDHILEEHFQHAAGLFVDETRDTLHATTAGETPDGGLGNTLDVIAEDFPVTLGASLSETFSSFTATRHV